MIAAGHSRCAQRWCGCPAGCGFRSLPLLLITTEVVIADKANLRPTFPRWNWEEWAAWHWAHGHLPGNDVSDLAQPAHRLDVGGHLCRSTPVMAVPTTTARSQAVGRLASPAVAIPPFTGIRTAPRA